MSTLGQALPLGTVYGGLPPLCACYEAVGQVGVAALGGAQGEAAKTAALWLGVMLKSLLRRYASSGGGLVKDISQEAEGRQWRT